ncbi:MAG: putative membrane protein YeiH [Lentimonas sp.]|jgi:uncharacterized membrane protein YeiH
MDYESLIYWIGLAGIAVFAVTGVLAVLPKGVDLFGATVIGMLTALGGGTLRDLVLDVSVFWSIDSLYVWVALFASFITFLGKGLLSRAEIFRLMLYLNGLGVALFSIQAASQVWALNFGPPVTPVVLGVVTAVGGGLMRDVLAGRPNLLMTSHELYLTPVTLGCVLYSVSLYCMPDLESILAIVCVAFIFAFRSAAIYWNLGVPKCLVSDVK